MRPLVVDLDGTLIRTDLAIESFFSLLSTHPGRALAALGALGRGRAAFKARIAEQSTLDLAILPFNEAVIGLLRAEKAKGRPIYLASAADRRFVEAMAQRLGLFEGIFASDGKTNLAGAAKAAALRAAFGEGGFDYAGNDLPDLAVWAEAREAIVVNGSARVLRAVRRRFPNARELGNRTLRLKDYGRALRLYQWVKNLLIFVPALAAHDVAPNVVVTLLVAFLSFSLCASSAYLLNDLFDLAHDRAHPNKRARPFAAGQIPLLHGMILVPALLCASAALALTLTPNFIALLCLYFIGTVAYSMWLKRKMTVDVLTLACLYGLRLMAGAAAAGVPLSTWFVGFSLFLFLFLAIVKRCAELVTSIEAGKGDPAGRGYQLRDLPVLESMAAASGYVAVLVFALYIASPQVELLYSAPQLLWLICIVLIYWISRVLVMTRRGFMKDDPIVFAAGDRMSLVSGALTAALLIAASL